jgi:spore maturation protein CgeB
MKLVIFGLTVSSTWGNGHATLWRGLCRALAARGHDIVFFERDVPYYADHRDLSELPGGRLVFYQDWDEVRSRAEGEVSGADAAMATSYCPDGPDAADLILESTAAVKVFYDLDTPVTLDRLQAGLEVPYLSPRGLGEFDLVLSYTGGPALDELRTRLGARRVAPLYGSVDPDVHRRVEADDRFRADLSYLGTYSNDRQARLQELLVEPARREAGKRFLLAGAQYPSDFPWTPNMVFLRHLAPPNHPAFYSSSRFTLNVTRRAMARMGYCPSGRLFEAAACGATILTDDWPGLGEFFRPGREIVLAGTTEEVRGAMLLSDRDRRRIGEAARDRALGEHSARTRALQLEELLERGPQP